MMNEDNIASQSEAYNEMVKNMGQDRPNDCWILTPYDTWERNPAYEGPLQPHPEDDYPQPEDIFTWEDQIRAEMEAQAWSERDLPEEADPDEDPRYYPSEENWDQCW